MSLGGMTEAWQTLRPQLEGLYEDTGAHLREGEPLELEEFYDLTSTLDDILDASERVRWEAEPELRRISDLEQPDPEDARYQMVAERLLAVAAVDAMLARDVAALDPEIPYDRSEDLIDEGLTPERVYEEGQDLIAAVGALFGEEQVAPGMGGGQEPQNPREALREAVASTTVGLVNLAEPSTKDLMGGMLSVAAGGTLDILGASQYLDVLDALKRTAQRLHKRAPKFLREYVAKVAALDPDTSCVDDLADCIAKRLPVRPLLEGVAATSRGIDVATKRIYGAPETAVEEAIGGITYRLDQLRNGFSEQIKWISSATPWLKRGAKLITHLIAIALPVAGYAVMPGVFFLGIAYVVYALTDRIDARNLRFADRVEGVVRIVTRELPA